MISQADVGLQDLQSVIRMGPKVNRVTLKGAVVLMLVLLVLVIGMLHVEKYLQARWMLVGVLRQMILTAYQHIAEVVQLNHQKRKPRPQNPGPDR